MKIPENFICGRIKIESYFISHISDHYFGRYCKIIINDVEMFTRLESGTSECARQMIDKFLEGGAIIVAIPKGCASLDFITNDQYRCSRHYLIRLEKNKNWVSIE